jgi:hypothetical protein
MTTMSADAASRRLSLAAERLAWKWREPLRNCRIERLRESSEGSIQEK